MILNSADNFWHAAHALNDPIEVCTKTWSPFGLNEGSSLFGREDDLIVQWR
jgi:hypothetical protein